MEKIDINYILQNIERLRNGKYRFRIELDGKHYYFGTAIIPNAGGLGHVTRVRVWDNGVAGKEELIQSPLSDYESIEEIAQDIESYLGRLHNE